MNILLTTEFYFPNTGGAEIVVKTIAEGMIDLGHTVTVATSKIAKQNSVYNGVSILPFSISGNIVKGIKEHIHGEIARYINTLQNGKWDVIVQYAAQTWHTDLAFPILESIPAARILIPCGFSGLSTFIRRLAYWRYFKNMPNWLRKYDICIYGDDSYLDASFSKYHGITDYTIIPNGIWLSEFDVINPDLCLRNRLGLPINKKIILNVSNHYSLKGHRRLIQQFSNSNINDALLVIVGNDPAGRTSCYNNCKKMESKLKNVYLLSNIPRDDVVRLYKECELFILTSNIEFFPLVILEAMYSEKPIASTDVGCISNFCKFVKIMTNRNMIKVISDCGFNFPKLWINENKSSVINKYNWKVILKSYEQAFYSGILRRKNCK